MRFEVVSPIISHMQSDSSGNGVAVFASGVYKSYGSTSVLTGIDLSVERGSAFGLVGLNGAGKTTFIKCMLDFCTIDQGSFEIFGVSHTSTAARIPLAFVPERFAPPHYLTCREFIRLTSSLAGAKFRSDLVDQVFDELRLERSTLGRPVRELSKGMTQKLGLAACFLVERDLYVLDEPMSGLDPASRVAVKSVLARLKREGRTLFFTSHVLADVEELCSTMAVLDKGRVQFFGSPTLLRERYMESNLERAFMRCINADQPAVTC
jgi:ABC-2 type transport system ATP-binding protein